MVFRCVIVCLSVAVVVHAGFLPPTVSYAAPTITSQSANIYRSAGNLGQISTYTKSIDTPFSSVRKADVRISNPGYRVAAAPTLTYAAPAPLLGVGYSAAPAVAHVTFDSGVTHYAF